MKKILSLALLSGMLLMNINIQAQTDTMQPMQHDSMMTMQNDSSMQMNNKPPEDKSKRPSPPAAVSATTSKGVTIKIDYSQPSLKGREIGNTVEPKKETVWRTGANEATVFEVNKDVTINGKTLPAGKYGLFTIWHGDTWTIIFNKTWDQWGAFNYNATDDALRIDVPNMKPTSVAEKMTFWVDKDGKVTLAWGDASFSFTVK